MNLLGHFYAVFSNALSTYAFWDLFPELTPFPGVLGPEHLCDAHRGPQLAQDWDLNFHLPILINQVLWVITVHCSRESKEDKTEERRTFSSVVWQKVLWKGHWGSDNMPSRKWTIIIFSAQQSRANAIWPGERGSWNPGNKHPGMKNKATNLPLVGWSRKHNQPQPHAVNCAWLRISLGDVGTMKSCW